MKKKLMKKKLGLPIQGSKRSLAERIVSKIIEDNPKSKIFYDVFGGGGAVALEALRTEHFDKVYYNDLNSATVELLKELQTNGFVEEKYTEFISREDFFEHKDNKTWFGGYVSMCWSFGSNQRTYLYSKEKEIKKIIYHNLVIEPNESNLKNFNKEFGVNLNLNDIDIKTIRTKRLSIKKILKDRFDIEHLERLQHLENLEHLEGLQHLEGLIITNLDYKDIIFEGSSDDVIVYLDPPYQNTSKYQEGLNHEELWEWVNEIPYNTYISEYNAPFDVVMEMNHRSTLSKTNNSKKVIEKLFFKGGN